MLGSAQEGSGRRIAGQRPWRWEAMGQEAAGWPIGLGAPAQLTAAVNGGLLGAAPDPERLPTAAAPACAGDERRAMGPSIRG